MKHLNAATVALLIALSLAGIAAPVASAEGVRTTSCRYDKTLTANPGPIENLRIRQSARRVNNYLTRCNVASFVAGNANGSARIDLMAARWFIGVFRCTYRYHGDRKIDETVISTRCEHRGKYASVVWFDAYA